MCLGAVGKQVPDEEDEISEQGKHPAGGAYLGHFLGVLSEYDLTVSLQQFVNSNYSLRNKRLEYMYNSDWIDDFLKLKAYEWITGFISGFIEIRFTHVGTSASCEVALITRRDKRRQGKRWIIRGCDLDGNSANTA